MGTRYRIGAVHDVHVQPLVQSFQSSSPSSEELLFDTPSSHIERLLEKELNAAFVSPMDYALNSSDLILLPDVGVSSFGFSEMLRLYLRGDTHELSTMAVGTVAAVDVVLSRIVLGEKYDSAPTIVPVLGTIDNMLTKGDCALVSEERILSGLPDRPFIDIVDEWSDITELPFVHTICVMRNDSYTKELHDVLLNAQEQGRRSLDAIARLLAEQRTLSNEKLSSFLSHLTYGLDDGSKQSLEEFYRMAFYYGMLSDVPEINVPV